MLQTTLLGRGSVAAEYGKQRRTAKFGKQEFVLHFVQRYDSEAPIWAATEFMTMGCLVSPLDLMVPKDQRRIDLAWRTASCSSGCRLLVPY